MGATRAFICDFDGTLYRHDATPTISDADSRAIDAFRQAGGLFGASSFRPPHAVTLQSHDAVLFDLFVSAGGALVCDAEGAVVFERRLPYDVVAQLCALYAPTSPAIVIAAGRDLYTVGFRGHHLVRGIDSLADLPRELYGVCISTTSVARAAAIARDINALMGDVVTATTNVTGVEVVASGCDKVGALSELRRAYGIGMLAAMGDADNDRALLWAADRAYARGDASCALAGAADLVVAGVAEALDDFANRVDELSLAS